MEPLWGEPGEGGPRWCWKSCRDQGWQSAEQPDWHYWCHKDIALSCKIQIFIHYVDPSDGDPCPRTTDILEKASAACAQLNTTSPASSSMQSIQSTSDESHSNKLSAKFWSCCLWLKCKADPCPSRVTNTTETHAEVNCMHTIGLNKCCWPARQDMLRRLCEHV